MFSRREVIGGMLVGGLGACALPERRRQTILSTTPPAVLVELFDPQMEAYVAPDETGSVLATGFRWAEGPTWDSKRERLYFSDVPLNVAWQWDRNNGLHSLLRPSGISDPDPAVFREPGSNGLLYEAETDSLLICNHGRRMIERMDMLTMERQSLAELYNGKRFHSPNDVAKTSDGRLFFTDPPYGLAGINDSPLKELPFNGVYMRDKEGDVHLLVDDLTYPNGVAISPDQELLYVSQSDADRPVVKRYSLTGNTIQPGEVFFDASPYADMPGLPDGMTVLADGTLVTSAPGGVYFIAADGRLLGRLLTGRPTANCCTGENGEALFITAQDRVLRVSLRPGHRV